MENEHLQSSFDKAAEVDKVISIKPTENPSLKNVWHFTKETTEEVSQLVKRKVSAVAETNIGGVISWKGDFESGEYFLIIVIDGVLYASMNEHEMMLPYDLKTVAYLDQVKTIVENTNDIERIYAFAALKQAILPKIMVELNFKEIMNIFMWEYSSTQVEIYETIWK